MSAGHFENPPDHLSCGDGATCMQGALAGQFLTYMGKDLLFPGGAPAGHLRGISGHFRASGGIKG